MNEVSIDFAAKFTHCPNSATILPCPNSTYVALDAHGQETTGFDRSRQRSEAIVQLRQAGYFPPASTKKASRAGEKKARRSAKTVRGSAANEA